MKKINRIIPIFMALVLFVMSILPTYASDVGSESLQSTVTSTLYYYDDFSSSTAVVGTRGISGADCRVENGYLQMSIADSETSCSYIATIDKDGGIPINSQNVIVEFELLTTAEAGVGYGYVQYNHKTDSSTGKVKNATTFGFNGLGLRTKYSASEDTTTITQNQVVKLGMKLDLTNGKYYVYKYNSDSEQWLELGYKSNSASEDPLTVMKFVLNTKDGVTNGNVIIDNFIIYTASDFVEDVSALLPPATPVDPPALPTLYYYDDFSSSTANVGKRVISNANYAVEDGYAQISLKEDKTSCYLKTIMNDAIPKESTNVIVEFELSTSTEAGVGNGWINYHYGTTSSGSMSFSQLIAYDGFDITDYSSKEKITTITKDQLVKYGIKLDLTTGTYTIHVYNSNTKQWSDALATVEKSASTADLSELRFIFKDSARDALMDNVAVYTAGNFVEDVSDLLPQPEEPTPTEKPTSPTEPKIYFYYDFNDGAVTIGSKSVTTKTKLTEIDEYAKLQRSPGATGSYYLKAKMDEAISKESKNVIVEIDLSTTAETGVGVGFMNYNSGLTSAGANSFTATIAYEGFKIFSMYQGSDEIAAITKDQFVKLGIKLDLTTGSYTVHLYNNDTKQWTNAVANVTKNSGSTQDLSEMRFIVSEEAPDESNVLIDNFVVYTADDFYENLSELLPNPDEVQPMPADKYPVPTVTPPANTHPRVMFTAEDLPTIRQNLTHAENAEAYEMFKVLKEKDYSGKLEKSDSKNYDKEGLAIIEAKAFDYILNRDSSDEAVANSAIENGQEAVAALKNYLSTFYCQLSGTNYRDAGHALFTAAEVYDWCYDLIKDDETSRAFIVAKCQFISLRYMEVGFPPVTQSCVSGHGAEAQTLRDWISLAIATYDEYPDIYNYVVGMYFEEFVPARNYLYQSGGHYQGSSYGPYRFRWDLYAQILLSNMSKVDDVESVYVEEAAQVAYHWIYSRRPDSELLREGDDGNEKTSGMNVWYNNVSEMLFLASNFYKDGVLKKEFLNNVFVDNGFDNITSVQMLALNDPTIQVKSVKELPLTKYIGSPLGSVLARTGWTMGETSPDVLAYMKIGETWTGGHNHRDAGNFQIYYKGILASESGAYVSFNDDHDKNYNKSSIAHNTLAITSTANPTGEQRKPTLGEITYETFVPEGEAHTGEVIGQEFGPDIYTPEYTYIAGDIADAYDDNVQEAVRSMLFMPLEDEEHPAAFIVFDRITTAEANSTKTFMIHMQSEPTISGNVTTITNTEDNYNGMLTNQTLLPINATITPIGGEGKEHMIGDTNYAPKDTYDLALFEKGWGRVEVSTTTAVENQTDYFLNVMYVNDANVTLEMEEAEVIYGSAGAKADAVVGAKVFNRVAMFNTEKARTAETIAFSIPEDEDVTSYKVNVAGLLEGTWTITTSNGTQTAVATQEGGIVYFSAPAGNCTLTRSGDENTKEFTQNKPVVEESGIDIRVNGRWLYTPVEAEKSEDEFYLPLETLFAVTNAEVNYTEESVTINVLEVDIEVTKTCVTATLPNGTKKETMDIKVKEDDILVPGSFLLEVFGTDIKIEQDAVSEIVDVTIKIVDPVEIFDYSELYPNAIEVQKAYHLAEQDVVTSIWWAMDGEMGTYWGASGLEGAELGYFDLGQVYTLDEILVSYSRRKLRTATLGIAVSIDGENYTRVWEQWTSEIGPNGEFESIDMGDVKARFVKFFGYGTSRGDVWNSFCEIVFCGEAISPSEPTPEIDPTPTPVSDFNEDDYHSGADNADSPENSNATNVTAGKTATGDNSNILLWSTLLIFAVVGFISVIIICRKEL